MPDSLNDLLRLAERAMLGTNIIFKDRDGAKGRDGWLGADAPLKGLTYEQSNRKQRNQLQLAVERGDIAKVRELARMKHLVNHQDVNGDTALILAVKRNLLFAVRALLAEKADPGVANQQGETAFTLGEKSTNPKLKEELQRLKNRVGLDTMTAPISEQSKEKNHD